jgi:hypothetical protein
MEEEYNRLVMLCRDKKLDFDITCGAKENKQFILKLMDCPTRVIVDKVEYYLGSKYQVLMYNITKKVGKANFNNKRYYNAIQNIIREFND